MSNISLTLTTVLKPTRKLLIKSVENPVGDEYEIRGMDHLSAEEEAEAMALFARMMNLGAELEATSNLDKGKVIATKLAETRVAVITKLTTIPKDKAFKLPISQQAKLVDALQSDMDPDEDDPGIPDTEGDGD